MARTTTLYSIGAMVTQNPRTTLGEIYARHADSAKRLAYLLTGDQHLSEDLTQDAFVNLPAASAAFAIPRPSAPTFVRRS
jgi:DNA-directed RNA polymerase specialized sigma24 family protein